MKTPFLVTESSVLFLFKDTAIITVVNAKIRMHPWIILHCQYSCDHIHKVIAATQKAFKMAKLTLEERLEVFKLYQDHSARLAAQLFNASHPERQPISHVTVLNISSKFDETGTLKDRIRSGRPSKRKNEQIINNVLEQFNINPHASSRNVARDNNVSQSIVLNILHDNSFHPYKARPVQHLKHLDAAKRLEFAQEMIGSINNDEQFLRRILFSDESLFVLRHSFNRQNKRNWSNENPHWTIDSSSRALKAEQVMVWAGIIDGHLIGPYMFEENVSGPTYLAMLQNYLVPALTDLGLDMNRIIFQQDGAAPHFVRDVKIWLTATFESWIGKGGPTLWPARSSDYNPLDFFLWSYVKDKVYQTAPTDMGDLKEKIMNAFAAVPPNMLHALQRSVRKRMALTVEHEGGHIQQYL